MKPTLNAAPVNAVTGFETDVQKKWRTVGGVLALAATVWLLGTSTFMFNATETRFVAGMSNDFGTGHNCLTSYVVAAHLAAAHEANVYDPFRYRNAEQKTPVHDSVEGIFGVDSYHYPPTFLAFPWMFMKVFGDFFAVRTAWYVLTVLVLLGAVVALARWCGVFRREPGLMLMPLLLCAPTVHVALVMGNAHVLVLSASVLAMVLLESGKHPAQD